MRKQFASALVTTMAVSVGLVGFVGPANAAQEGNSGAWEMPDVRSMTLQRAIDSVLSVTGDVDLDLDIRNRKDVRQVINYTNWEVCAQAPRGGQNISKKAKRVILVVRRPMTRGC
ncbi:hypothetical protein [Mycolicibacterium poriferae]|uniref:hypothetical protein n=1 Tax=Mycolicibacterium poriferae TaxID=39694 RepID=UPI0024B9AEB4|nr:hypothetical protein [Mycolicibacterium poriferae]